MNSQITPLRSATPLSTGGSVTLLRDAGHPPVAAPANNVTVLSLLTCVRRRWKQATLLGLIFGGMAFAFVWLFLPPTRPFAYTKLCFPAKATGSVDHPDPPVNQRTQKERITSRVVLKTVVNDPTVAALPTVQEKDDPLAWLLREVAVDFPEGSEICKITVTDDRAEDAKVIVDKLASLYLTRLKTESFENREAYMTKLTNMIAAAKADLNGEVDATGGGTDGNFSGTSPQVMAQRQELINTDISRLGNELLKVRGDLDRARAEEKRIAARLEKTPVELTYSEFEQVFALNPNANQLKLERQALSANYTQMGIGLGADNPSMVALKNKIDAMDSRLEALRKEMKSLVATGFEEKLTDDRRKVQDEIARLQFDEKAKQNDIDVRQGQFEKLTNATSNAGRHRPGLEAKAIRLQELQTRKAKLESEMSSPIAAYLIEDEAVVTRPNDASRRMKMAAMAAAGCFGMMFVLLGFWEFRAHRVAGPQEANSIGLRLMGTLPNRPNHTSGVNEAQWEAVLNEAMDTTRTVFLHAARVNNLRTVLVTSAVGGEGKTSLSTRLASSLARSGRRTLLIDGDLRNPSIHKFLAGQPTVGTCEVLRGQIPVRDAIVAATMENLWVLPGGKCDKFAIDALARDGFAKILEEVGRHEFDFILIDSAPVLPVADTLLIAKNVDGVLMSMMVDVSQIERVNVACQKLAALEIPLLGTVVQGTRSNVYGYGPEYATPVMA